MPRLAPLLCLTLLAGCAQLKLTRVKTDLVEEEHERTVIGMDHVRVSHEVVDEGARLRLLVERHDLCQVRRFEIRTPARKQTGEVKRLGWGYASTAALAAVAVALYTAGQDKPSSPEEADNYQPGRGCARDGTTNEANCTKDYEAYMGLSAITGGLALLALGHTAYVHSQDGVQHEILGDAKRVMTDDQQVACRIRTFQRAEVVLFDERGKELSTARTSKSGHAWLNTLNAHPDHLFRFEALVRDDRGEERRLRVTLDPDQRAALTKAIARHRKRRAPPNLQGQLVFDDSGGDGDRRLDAGEEAALLIKVRNTGRGPAEGVVAVISPPEALRQHFDAPWRVPIGDLPPGEARLGRMKIFAHEDLPKGEARFQARLSEELGFDSGAFASSVQTTALRRPVLQLTQHGLWDDGREASQGNGNGRIEPNELIALEVMVANSGEGVAQDVEVGLESASRHVRVTQEPVKLGALLPGQRRRVLLGFTVARRYKGADLLPLRLRLRERRPRFSVTPPLEFKLNAAAASGRPVDVAEAPAVARIAILELNNEAALAPQEVTYLTDLIREEALHQLPRRRYFVMTRENILEQLPPGVDLANCEGACEVETGRNVGADFVISGRVLRFGADLRVALKLHETKKGALLSAGRASGGRVSALESGVVEASQTLLGPLPR